MSNSSTLHPRRHHRRTIPFSDQFLPLKRASAAGQARCSRRIRSNPQASRTTARVTVELRKNRHHLGHPVHLGPLPSQQLTACSSQDRPIAGRNDWRAHSSQDFAGRRTKGDGAQWRRPTNCKRLAAAHASDLDSFCRLPIPRQQFIEPIDRMPVDHALEHVVQIRVGFDIVQFGSFNERTERRPARSAVIRSSEQMILSTEGNLAVILPISGRML